MRGFTTSLENTKTAIVALAVLHNIAIQMGEDNNFVVYDENPPIPPEDYLVTSEDLPQVHNNNSIQGKTIRAAFINDFFKKKLTLNNLL